MITGAQETTVSISISLNVSNELTNDIVLIDRLSYTKLIIY